ncbi:MAG: putative rane protein [Gemmatimonadetes bacterium]|jgi:putative ABC transport system permease protein|nr:putative rane protein [Gemmatimonadota bacterium]
MVNPILTTSLSVGFETLRSNPLRTILSTLGIVIGVAALVSVLSVGDGMERLAREQIGRTTDLQRISVSPRLTRIVDETPFPVPNPPKFTLVEASSLRALVGDSGVVNMVVNGAALVATAKDTTSHGAQIVGLLARDANGMPDSALLAGRVFTDAEGASGAPVVVISYKLATDVAHGRQPRDLVGDTLLFQGQPRAVIGVLKAVENDRARRAIMPVGALAGATISGQFERPAQLLVTAKSVEGVATTRATIERWTAREFGPSWKDRVNVVSDESRLAQVQKALLLFKLFMGALMSISLVVGGIGIMNVLLSSVIERTREIGIRKATGAAQRHILWQFLCESVAITGVGSMIGLVLGVAAAFAVTAIMRHVANAPIQAWLSVSTVVVAIGASVVIGLTFGLYPAMRAARLSPIDAIHHE